MELLRILENSYSECYNVTKSEKKEVIDMPGHGGPHGGPHGGFGGGPRGGHGHMPPPPPHRGFGHRTYRRGCMGCLPGCMMPVLAAVGIIVLALVAIF